MNDYINPTKAQSRKWILDALFSLMKEKDFIKITITSIAEHAGLDRKTFYRNFKSKEEVLALKLEEVCLEYIEILENLSEWNAYQLSHGYFSLCYKHIDLLKILQQNKLLFLLLMKFDEYLPYLNDLFKSNPNYRYKTEYELVYQSGGFWNATLYWINNGMKESVEEISEIISLLME